jgi:hypothetical protein
MPALKLTYFDARGRAETARLVLAYAGVQYEDERLTGGAALPIVKTSLHVSLALSLSRMSFG